MKKAIVLFAFAVVCSEYALAQNDKDVPIIRMKDDNDSIVKCLLKCSNMAFIQLVFND